jgi:hypothetical protein
MDWKLFSVTEPTTASPGRIWINPSNGFVYIRLGNTWIPFVTGASSIDFTKRLVVLINYEDKTAYIEKGSISIEDVLTREVNTCSFLFTDNEGTNKPQTGQDVMIFYRETAVADPVLIFAGRLSEIPQAQYAYGKYQYELTAVDYTQCLSKKNVVEVYESTAAGDIIRDIVETYAPELGCLYVQDGLTVDYISFNYKFPIECITELADLIGYDWYVDYDKNIHFFAPGTDTAPYSLTEDSTSGLFSGLEITVNKEELKNKVTIRGGYELSALYEQVREAEGTQTSFNLDYEPYAPMSVYVDVGAGYVAHTLGIDNIDTTGYDFVVNVSEKVIKNLDHATLTAGHKLKITYKYKKPIMVEVDDQDSIKLMKKYEGGDGIYEASLIVDETIQTRAQAKARGNSELEQYSNPLVEGSFITNQYGYHSGQLLTVNLPSRDINEQYLIQNVTATSLGNGLFEYEITFATKLKGLTDFLLMLYDSGRKIIERDDEILEKLKVFKKSLIIVGAITDTQFVNVSTNPAVWSNDAGTTPDRGYWNLFQWGGFILAVIIGI